MMMNSGKGVAMELEINGDADPEFDSMHDLKDEVEKELRDFQHSNREKLEIIARK